MPESGTLIHSKAGLAIIAISAIIILLTCSGCITTGIAPDQQDSSGEPVDHPDTGITITDSLGNTVTLPHTARRIICQNGMAAELLVAIGSGDHIVGVSDALMTERYVIEKIPQAQSIGDWQTPNIERIITLKPDVMIVYSSKTLNIDKITAANITVIYADCNRVRDLPKEARNLGKLTGKDQEAERYARYVEGYLNLIDERLANLTESERPRVYVEMYRDYMAQGRGSTGDSILKSLKARNIAENITTSSAVVSPDWIIQQDPDVILKYVSRAKNLSEGYESMRTRPEFSPLRAMHDNRVYAIKGDAISGPRGVSGLLYVAKTLYPDRFADIDPKKVLHEYAEMFVSGADSIETYLPDPI
ncbi:MAG: ABC transporter substrate-binding protein [Methanoregula sp.]|nr:ABC transporter substrate-binding protein [Methanoregula sp.]